MSRSLAPACIVRWLARISSVAMMGLWGGFFIAHLSWLRPPFPPPWVIGVLALHAMLLAGLAIGWRFEGWGAALVIGAAIPFFALSAGPNAVPFTAATCIPAILWLASIWLDRRSATAPSTATAR
ncbi:MAG: hypothetical protein KF774_03255 [Planctomyces sp.]|nr:hypothetical protein [Planctomyces sp.]